MAEIRAVLFDMWDTLIYNDQKNNIMKVIASLLGIKLVRENWKRLEEAFMKKRYDHISDAAADIGKYFHIDNPKITEKFAEIARDSIKPRIFPDVIPALDKLNGYKLGIVSNTISFNIDNLKENLFNHFDVVCLSCDLGVLKPDLRIFRAALERLGVKPGEAVMFGDNYQDDIEPGIKLGMETVLVKRDSEMLTWEENHNSERAVKSLDEISRFLK
jgi:putative hydrolase of the HAD superfamily